MIKTKQDLNDYIEKDRIAMGYKRNKPRFYADSLWKYMIKLRKVEYYNNRNSIYHKIMFGLHKLRFNRYVNIMHFDLGLNVFGPGLQIYHPGIIIVNNSARIGKNCRIYNGVNIANDVVIGKNSYIGPGAKILSGVHLGDNVRIGANAVVSKSFSQGNITIGGIPARHLSNNGSNHVTWED